MNPQEVETDSENLLGNKEWRRVSRDELYTKVWAEPMVRIAKEFGISDRGLPRFPGIVRWSGTGCPQAEIASSALLFQINSIQVSIRRFNVVPEVNSFQEIVEWIKTPSSSASAIDWIQRGLTAWTVWAERHDLEGMDAQGLYLIAEWQAPRQADVLDRRITLIGETQAQRLVDRLDQFDNTAFRNRGGHGPGYRHRDRPGAGLAADVYVSILPIRLDEPWRTLIPPLLEGVLLWNYKSSNGDLPVGNRTRKNASLFGVRAVRAE